MQYILSEKEMKRILLALKYSNEICNSVMNMESSPVDLLRRTTNAYNSNNQVLDILDPLS